MEIVGYGKLPGHLAVGYMALVPKAHPPRAENHVTLARPHTKIKK